MTSEAFIGGKELRRLLFGTRVARASAVLPATGVSTPYFSVSNGAVLITSLIGICTAAADASATTLLFSAVPTLGAANNMCAVSASLASMVVGGVVSLDGTSITTALQATAPAAGGNIGGMAKPVVVQPGTINALTAITNTTLAFRWVLTYVPLDDGAYVTAL